MCRRKLSFVFERVEGRSCIYGLGVCRFSPFIRICIRDSDEDLVDVSLILILEPWGFGYAVLFNHVGFPRLFVLSQVGEEGYNGGVLDRDPVEFVFI